MKDSIYGMSAKANDGREIRLSDYEGKVLLIVNTASRCGFTPQYAGLEELHRRHADKGLVVLGFPCDQFAYQEPGSDAEIADFCRLDYGVTFTMMAKVEVNGKTAHPLFRHLRMLTPGFIGDAVKWNFTKFLVSRDGTTVRRYAPTVTPAAMEADILKALEG